MRQTRIGSLVVMALALALAGSAAGDERAAARQFEQARHDEPSLIAFLVGVLVVARATFRRPMPPPVWTLAFPMLVLFLLTSKVYSPQYALWLLPFFVLVMPDFRLFALFEIADAAVFLTEFSWIGHRYRGDSISAWPLAIAVTVRAAVLLAILVTYVRRGPTVLNVGDPNKKMLTQGLVALAVSQGYKGDWSGLFAGLTIAMLPVLAAYIIFQRQVVAGLTAGALK